MRERPAVVTAFGVLHIVFGGLALCCTPFALLGLFMPSPEGLPPELAEALAHPVMKGWTIFSTAVTGLLGLALVVAGIGLFYLQEWARKVSLAYALVAILTNFVGLALSFLFFFRPMMEQLPNGPPEAIGVAVMGLCGGLCGSALSLIYPLFILYFLTRPDIVDAFRP